MYLAPHKFCVVEHSHLQIESATDSGHLQRAEKDRTGFIVTLLRSCNEIVAIPHQTGGGGRYLNFKKILTHSEYQSAFGYV